MNKILLLHIILSFRFLSSAMEQPPKRTYNAHATQALKAILNDYAEKIKWWDSDRIIEQIMKLIQDGAYPDVAGDLEINAGRTVLLLATEFSYPDLALFLLQNHADPNITLPNGASALHFAAERGMNAVCRALINRGANVNAQKSNLKITPLMNAVINNYQPTVKLLLSEGAIPADQSRMGRTALNIARRVRPKARRDPAIIELLEKSQKMQRLK